MQKKMINTIIKKIHYPKRLLKGLDDIDIDNLRDYLVGNKIFAVGIRMTNVCNYNCVYCGTSEKRGTNSKFTLTTDEYINIIEEANKIGVSTIILGGNGEPTFQKDIVKIIKQISKYNMIPVVFTNAYIFGDDNLCNKIHGISGEELLNVFDDAGASLIISCETIDAKKYNQIVGLDSFDVFMVAIDRIKKTKLVEPKFYNSIPLCRIAFSTVVMPINYNDCKTMKEFAHSLNGLIIFKLPSLHGSAATNSLQMFNVDEGNNIKEQLYDLSDKQATLQILNLACVAWALGISINNEGFYMSCMTDESNPYGRDINIRNTKIEKLLGKRKELISLCKTICPIKDKYYV
ncbi:MAG: hypothetical protein BGN88_09850 [Clostridiales bacterium 43-6]|nr:MAG: hypothetical protein BGN88_09850 [Clostridiales bacterium 43-6]